MRPESFDDELSTEWSRWVLEHGLPELPERLVDGESVPVVFWIGPESAAVLHLRRRPADEYDAAETDVDIEIFDREADGWDAFTNGGSGGWPDPELRRVQVPPEHAELDGAAGGSIGRTHRVALWGEVGTAAATLEVEQDGVVTCAPIDSPLGWVVVSGRVGSPFTARVRDAAGTVLTEAVGPPADWLVDPYESSWPMA